MNPSFNITTENTPLNKPNLFISAGKQGISFIQLDTDSNTFISVLVYHFAKNLTATAIAEQVNEIVSSENLSQQHFKKIFVTWCFDENVFVPQEYFDAGNSKEMLVLVHGDLMQGAVQNELVATHNLHTVYKIPAAVKNIFNIAFPFCIQNHQSSLLINFEKNNKDLLYCNFYPEHLTVLLRKNGQLQIIQQFEYASPEDAVYHLLNVCQSFETDAAKTILTVSGMIDTDSNLYSELYKYFQSVNCADLSASFNYAEEIKDHPAHYFSHLFATASCVL
ncbi:DUF3822 family protein [Ferruginibacter sp.]